MSGLPPASHPTDANQKFMLLISEINNVSDDEALSALSLSALSRKLDSSLELLFSHYIESTLSSLLDCRIAQLLTTPPPSLSTNAAEAIASFLRFLSRVPLNKPTIPFIPQFLSLLSHALPHQFHMVSMSALELLRTLCHRNFLITNAPNDAYTFFVSFLPIFDNDNIINNLNDKSLTFYAGLSRYINFSLLQFLSQYFKESSLDPPLVVMVLRFCSNFLNIMDYICTNVTNPSPAVIKLFTRMLMLYVITFKRRQLISEHISKFQNAELVQECHDVLNKFTSYRHHFLKFLFFS
ncbi:hypothetical protein GEMRC1_002814 [Eukaryota sp. GEM-RC1]